MLCGAIVAEEIRVGTGSDQVELSQETAVSRDWWRGSCGLLAQSEHRDLQTAYGHYFLQVSNQAIEPLGECRSNVELFRALAEGMGFEDDCFCESVDQMIDAALDSEHPWLNGIDRERLEREGHVRLNFGDARLRSAGQPAAVPTQPVDTAFLPFARGNFFTASGKAELYSE